MALAVHRTVIQCVEIGHLDRVALCMDVSTFSSYKSTKTLMEVVCGNTTAHCGEGCQSGPCTGPPDVPAPGPSPAPAAANPGVFNIVGQSGVPAMHAGLMPNGRVIFLDKLENYTQIKLSDGYYAYSAEYDPVTNTAVGLQYEVRKYSMPPLSTAINCFRRTLFALVAHFFQMDVGCLWAGTLP